MKSKIVKISCIFISGILLSCGDRIDEKTDMDGYLNDYEVLSDADLSANDENIQDDTEESDALTDEDSFSNSEFEEGPYGTGFGDTAGDFTVPTEKGDWNFYQNRKKDENYIFVIYRSSNSGSTAIWKTDMIRMFENTPDNTHYFFAVDGSAELCEEKTALIKETIQTAFEGTGRLSIKDKIHIVTKPIKESEGWIPEWLENNSDYFFGIDRFQKIRKGGSFHSWKTSTLDPVFEFVYKEAELYNYESEMKALVDENPEKTTVITGIDGLSFEGDGWTQYLNFTVDFPKFEESGNLYIDLKQVCDDSQSCEWDRLQNLFLCSDETDESCTVEIGRWITTYGRSGHWLTDISPLIPFFQKSGEYKFKFTVTGDQYVNYLNFIYIEKNDVVQQSEIVSLFNGTVAFDETYNDYWKEMEIDIPEAAGNVLIASYITGHGNGSEAANCAEFCPFEAVFYVNDTPYEIDFDNAGTNRGCFDSVTEGTVPNQYGSWPYGRAGWCPGQDVRLITFDITDSIVKGQKNKFRYSAFLDGEVYVPEVTDPSGYRAEIPLTSYVTY